MIPQILFHFRVLSLLFGIYTFAMLFSYLSLNYFLLCPYSLLLTQSQGLLFSGELRETNRTIT